MKNVQFQLEALTCPSCIKKIEGTLLKQKGVEQARVLFHSSKVKITFDQQVTSAERLEDALRKLGYPPLATKNA
ncbi:heavy metal-binding protein [Ammoniphilus oxalaticus]|uniref:Heavy metal-binding protein n=1 Tax=Ammoniphilus oxalaticus TaxID=66863 RepID=A0A419SKT8_9BACL|nr:heavy metal-associated domain-containing protein [Ammoniphilus oxalaticus]RKD24621.1 heavy metal-binding protein [Ammoniphilus oxalaticus]